MQNDFIQFDLVKPLPHSSFDSDALKVYHRLREAHYKTYFVGGCIRDLLLGRTPKDFDIATAARPNQVCKLFRNGRVIGRRFLIVSVFFGSKMIEVTTFRKSPWRHGLPEKENLLVNSDNVFGTDEEDARRRDFTINALFYDVQERTVIDYVDGLKDLKFGHIRIIGEPEIRFSEDPVRIIRAIKLQAILGFNIVPETNQAIYKCVQKLSEASTARLFLELQKILRSGASHNCFRELADATVFGIISPDIQRIWYQDSTASFLLKQMLINLDNLTPQHRSKISEEILLSSICLPLLTSNKSFIKNNDLMMEISRQKLLRLIHNFNIPRRMMERTLDIIRTAIYLERTPISGLRNKKFVQTLLFSEALENLKLQSYGNDKKMEIYVAWQDFKNKEKQQKSIGKR